MYIIKSSSDKHINLFCVDFLQYHRKDVINQNNDIVGNK
jgi:hypothetical protein